MFEPPRGLARRPLLAALAWSPFALLGASPARAAYDETRDGRADLVAAIAQAKESNRLVLVLVGGNWCPTCMQLDAAIKASPRMQALLAGRFVLLKLNYSGRNKNKPAMALLPFFLGYPAAFVLDGQGRALDMPSVHGFIKRDVVDTERYADALEATAKGR